MHPLRNIFNKIFWDKRERKEDYEVVFTHRGVPNDQKTIPFVSIVDVGKSAFIYFDKGEKIIIPMHRVKIVRNIKNSKIMWRKFEK